MTEARFKFWKHSSPKTKEERRSEERAKDPRTAALDRCDDLIDWYDRVARKQRKRMTISRATAIVLSGVTPVLVVIQLAAKNLGEWDLILGILIAIFAAVVGIISALEGLFLWKDNWIRFSYAAEQLKSEKHKYLTSAGRRYSPELDEHRALASFVTKVESITIEETKGWHSLMDESEELESLLAIARESHGTGGRQPRQPAALDADDNDRESNE